MEDSQARRQAEARQALRELVAALRRELRQKGSHECSFATACPVARSGACPGIC